MQVTLDGTVKYCGHEIVKYKDGRTFVNLSIIDSDKKPLVIFCPGSFEMPLSHAEFGQEITLTFDVNKFNNNLTLRASEVFV